MPSRVAVRPMRVDDIPQILALAGVCFPSIPPERRWVPDMLEAHVRVFPDGQWVVERAGEIVGSATSLRVPLKEALRPHTWRSITGGGYLRTHAPDGSALYGTEIMVHPGSRRIGIAKRLYGLRKRYVVEQNLKAFVTGGRIPGYDAHAQEMSAREYVARVVAGELQDRVLTPQLRSGLLVVDVLPEYLTDPLSRDNATLLLWRPGRLPPVRALELDGAAHDPDVPVAPHR